MDQYEFIRTVHRAYGRNISELSRMTGHSRNTVNKALHGEPWEYSERKKQSFPVLGPYLETIDNWLDKQRGVVFLLKSHFVVHIYKRSS